MRLVSVVQEKAISITTSFLTSCPNCKHFTFSGKQGSDLILICYLFFIKVLKMIFFSPLCKKPLYSLFKGLKWLGSFNTFFSYCSQNSLNALHKTDISRYYYLHFRHSTEKLVTSKYTGYKLELFFLELSVGKQLLNKPSWWITFQ